MKRTLLLMLIITLAVCSTALAQCPGGRCRGRSYSYRYRAPVRYYPQPIYSAPVYAAPIYSAPVVVQPPGFGFSYSSGNKSFGFGSGGAFYSQGPRQCVNGRCR